jgi:hypothetical protein
MSMCPSCSSLFRVTILQVKRVNALDLISELVMVITCYWGYSSLVHTAYHSIVSFTDLGPH